MNQFPLRFVELEERVSNNLWVYDFDVKNEKYLFIEIMAEKEKMLKP